MEKITLYHTRNHEFVELTQEEFLAKMEQFRQKWEPGWYIDWNDVTHQILPNGRVDSIPNNEFFKDLIRRGLW